MMEARVSRIRPVALLAGCMFAFAAWAQDLPTVSVAANPTSVSEDGGTTTLTFTRTAPLNGELLVYFGVARTGGSGNATWELDPNVGSVVIPDAETSADAVLTGVTDGLADGDTLITVNVSMNAAYEVSTWDGSVVITLLEAEVLRTWRADGAGAWSDPSNWSPEGVPGANDDVVFDGSGLGNCAMDVDATVVRLRVTEDYTGTLSMGDRTLTAKHFSVSGVGEVKRLDAGTSTVVIAGGTDADRGTLTNEGELNAFYNLDIDGYTNMTGDVRLSGGLLTVTSGSRLWNAPGQTLFLRGTGEVLRFEDSPRGEAQGDRDSRVEFMVDSDVEPLRITQWRGSGWSTRFRSFEGVDGTIDFHADMGERSYYWVQADPGSTLTINLGSHMWNRTYNGANFGVNIDGGDEGDVIINLGTGTLRQGPLTLRNNVTLNLQSGYFVVHNLTVLASSRVVGGAPAPGETSLSQTTLPPQPQWMSNPSINIHADSDSFFDSIEADLQHETGRQLRLTGNINVGGDFTIIQPGGTLASNVHVLRFIGDGEQTFTDNSSLLWQTVEVAPDARVVQATDLLITSLTVDEGGEWDTGGNNLSVQNLFEMQGTFALMGDETIGLPLDYTATFGTWRYTGNPEGSPESFAIKAFGDPQVLRYNNLELQNNTGDPSKVQRYTIGGDLLVEGELRLTNHATIEAASSAVVTVEGALAGTGATAESKAGIGAAAGRTLRVLLDGGLHATDVPDYLVFENLSSSGSGGAVRLDVPAPVTWKGVEFRNLDLPKDEGGYYLETTGTALLTLGGDGGPIDIADTSVFYNMTNGVERTHFDPATSPGTIMTTSALEPAVTCHWMRGIGGNATDGDVGDDDVSQGQIHWTGVGVSEVSVEVIEPLMLEPTAERPELAQSIEVKFIRTREFGALTVTVLYGGSGADAVWGTHFSASAAPAGAGITSPVEGLLTVSFPDGVTEVTVTLAPLADGVATGHHHVWLTIQPSASQEYLLNSDEAEARCRRLDAETPPGWFWYDKPANNANMISLGPTLSWGASEEAVRYVVEISVSGVRDPDTGRFVTPIGLEAEVSAAESREWAVTPPTAEGEHLLGDTIYYWNVIAYSYADQPRVVTGAARSFTTAPNATYLDWDGDGIPNDQEPGDGVTEFVIDGLLGPRTVVNPYATDPLKYDTSGDGCPDGWCLYWGFDPTDPAVGGQDPDRDTYTNREEYQMNTNPWVSNLIGLGRGEGCAFGGGGIGTTLAALLALACLIRRRRRCHG